MPLIHINWYAVDIAISIIIIIITMIFKLGENFGGVKFNVALPLMTVIHILSQNPVHIIQ